MNAPYPSAPAAVPPDLAKPTPSHRRHTFLAFGALVAFVLLYLGLAAWFGFTAWRLAMGAWSSPDGFIGYVLAIPPLFLFAFLVKGLFFVRKGDIGDAVELRPEDEPALFAFIHRVADEAGAPRPHRVFLTPDVNASVFYDLSLKNLVWPSKKNLNIGLGLVNVLTLDELKAVLAHEFGHFAQREMALGTWVYVARQAIGAVVARRDGFDRFLDGLSRVDLRLAWIGWGMRVIVWAIRVVLDTAFRGLVVLERALSREMEFQADLVSVSLCGSDSLVHGLRRIGPADEAMSRATTFATAEGRAGRPIADLYAVQTAMLAKMRAMWNDPTLGEVPPRPEHAAAAHRVFSRGIAEVPRMWATHPPSHEREENAKARYVPSVLDPRPAWEVFADAAATRRRMTARLYAENMPEAAKAAVAPEADTAARLDESFTRPALDPAWRGVYVGRSAVRGVRGYKELFGPVPEDRDAIRAALDALYPDTIVETLRAWREAESQVSQLEALQKGLLTAPGGVLRFRGRTIPRNELPGVLAEARADRDELRRALADHDRAVRTAHRAAGRALGKPWELHLVGLAAVLHYAEHVLGDLEDAEGALDTTFRVVTADGNVSSSELNRLIAAANQVQEALAGVYGQARALSLPAPVLAKLEAASWEAMLGEELKLPPATREGLANNWLTAAATWIASARRCLDALETATLDALLEAEAHVARCFRDGQDPGEAPALPIVPVHYPTSAPGQERARERLDWWDRFQIADGWLPGAARLGAAASVLGPAVLFTQGMGTAEIVVHNGLGVPVVVAVGEERLRVPAGEERRVTVDNAGAVPIEAQAEDGRVIERFEADADHMWATYVYNVAQADVLASISIGYGVDVVPEPVILGAPRWMESGAHHVFEEPPSSIQADDPVVHTQVVGLDGMPAGARVQLAPEPHRAALALAHVRWDDATGPGFLDWANVGLAVGSDVVGALRERSADDGARVILGRFEQETNRDEACPAHTAAAAARPDDPDAVYLALRCLPDGTASASITEAAARFPEHGWLGWALAWEQMRMGAWDDAAATLERVAPRLAVMADDIAITRLRALRMAGAPLDAQIGALVGASQETAWTVFLAVEAGERRGDPSALDPWDRTTASLARGDLAEAAQSAESGWHKWMIAGSEGATTNDLEVARGALTAEDLGGEAVWIALALLARDGQDRAAVEAVAAERSERLLARLRPMLDAPPDAVVAAADAAVVGAPVHERGWVRLVGMIRLGDAAPAAWRREAHALLLPWERPWIRADGAVVRGAGGDGAVDGEIVGGGIVGGAP